MKAELVSGNWTSSPGLVHYMLDLSGFRGI